MQCQLKAVLLAACNVMQCHVMQCIVAYMETAAVR